MYRLLFFSLPLLSCGVKTAPHSSIIETRPVVPFRDVDPQKGEEDSKDTNEVTPQIGDRDHGKTP